MSAVSRPVLLLAILALGAYAQILQAILVRESLVVFDGNEISLGVFYACWLLWAGVGAWLARRPAGSGAMSDPRLLGRCLIALPPLLLLQVLALRSVRRVLDVSASELVPLDDASLVLLLVTAPSGLVLGLALPLAGRLPGGAAARLYAADALGALAGGALFSLVLVRWCGVVQSMGVLLALVGLMLWSLRAAPRRSAPWPAILVLGGGLLVLSPGVSDLESALERIRFASLQPGLTLVAATNSRYGHVAVARLGDQFSLVEDGQLTASFPQPVETATEAALLHTEANGPRRILLLGGFAGGLAAELLRYPIARLAQVEQDRAAFDLVAPHLPAASRAALADPRLRLIFADGRRVLRDLAPDERFDLVVIFAQSPTNAAGNRFFTQEFYDQVRAHLAPAGVFCTRVSGAANYVGRAIGGYAGAVYHTLASRFARIILVPGDPLTLCAAAADGPLSEDPDVLAGRYGAVALTERIFPAAGFASLLPAGEIQFLRQRLESTPAEIDSDARPVTYYLNTLLRGKLTASGLVDWMQRLRALGAWPYLLPALVLLGLWLLRAGLDGWPRATRLRQGAGSALFALGAATMAAALVLLLAMQSQVGLLFERIALLNGLLMAGLALGAGVGAWIVRRGRCWPGLVGVLLTVALGLLALPAVLAGLAALDPGVQAWAYLALALAVGLVAGAGFPPGVALARGSQGDTASGMGLALAADNLGGALGALVTGSLMVPLLGTRASCLVLAGLVLLAMLPLLHARWVPDRLPALAARGQRSLPWPGLVWWLAFLVLVALGWNWLARGAEPGPPTRFDATRLAEVAGPGRFSQVETPFVHYLGQGDDAGPRIAIAASQAVAPEVRGFAGPLNLLVALDDSGRLRGVRHLGSRETASYIAGIDQWLAGLAGQDLALGPLDLQRIDGLSGATVTSRAALTTINRTAASLSRIAFGHSTPHLTAGATPLDRRFWATLALLLLALPVYLSGHERAHLALLVGSVAVLGVWLNTPVTEVDLVNLLQGHAAAPAENPQRWLLWCFVAVTALLFGQLWCGCLCPFGALQELIARFGRRLGLRRYPDRRLDARLRRLPLLLLAAMLLAVLLDGHDLWAGFDPMQHLFGARAGGWMLALGLLILVASLRYVRPWCRYLCPLGACLALSNKLALLQRLAPGRRFGHCDLGARGEFDLGCIRCNRCLSGRDTHRLANPAASDPGRPNWPTLGAVARRGSGEPRARATATDEHRQMSPDLIAPAMHAHPRGRDLPLLALVLVALLLIGLHLQGALEQSGHPGSGGWRRIDRAALEQRIERGDLRDRRADWAHPTRPDERPLGPQGSAP